MTVTPDICYLTFVCETRDMRAGQAYRANRAMVMREDDAVQACGVETKDMQTVELSIMPEYHDVGSPAQRVFEDYLVRNAMTVKARDLNRVADIIDSAVSAGATEVRDVVFTVENPKRYTSQIRADAFNAAREKADSIARLAGVKLGAPVAISEDEPRDIANAPSAAQVEVSGRPYAEGEGEAARSFGLPEGETKLSLTMHVTYDYK
jgi:uncharacterized protein YggE